MSSQEENMTWVNLSKEEELKELNWEDIEIDWDKSCYDPATNTCDGSCQGGADCLRARYLWSLELDENNIPYEGENTLSKPTVIEMVKAFKVAKARSVAFNEWVESEDGQQFLKELKNDEDINELLKSIKYKGDKENDEK